MITKNYLAIYKVHWAPQYIALSIAMSHLSLGSIYFPQYPIIKHHQITFLPQYERRNFTHIKPKNKLIFQYALDFIYFNWKTRSPKNLHGMITRLPSLQSTHNFYLNLKNSTYSKNIFSIIWIKLDQLDDTCFIM